MLLIINFYPRPPRGGRPESGYTLTEVSVFLSTPSARRATILIEVDGKTVVISIHALREEGDLGCIRLGYGAAVFLSTPSARRATGKS